MALADCSSVSIRCPSRRGEFDAAHSIRIRGQRQEVSYFSASLLHRDLQLTLQYHPRWRDASLGPGSREISRVRHAQDRSTGYLSSYGYPIHLTGQAKIVERDGDANAPRPCCEQPYPYMNISQGPGSQLTKQSRSLTSFFLTTNASPRNGYPNVNVYSALHGYSPTLKPIRGDWSLRRKAGGGLARISGPCWRRSWRAGMSYHYICSAVQGKGTRASRCIANEQW